MRIDEKMRGIIENGEFLENQLMPLVLEKTKEDNVKILEKRGFTLKVEHSDLRELYQRQNSLNPFD